MWKRGGVGVESAKHLLKLRGFFLFFLKSNSGGDGKEADVKRQPMKWLSKILISKYWELVNYWGLTYRWRLNTRQFAHFEWLDPLFKHWDTWGSDGCPVRQVPTGWFHIWEPHGRNPGRNLQVLSVHQPLLEIYRCVFFWRGGGNMDFLISNLSHLQLEVVVVYCVLSSPDASIWLWGFHVTSHPASCRNLGFMVGSRSFTTMPSLWRNSERFR